MRVFVLLALTASAATGPYFVEEGLKAGLKDIFFCGDDQQKNYIVETLGTGVALVDFDNDGLLDVFAVTASRLEGFPAGTEPVNHLYRNKGNRTFEDVSRKAGVARSGWGQGVCAGDIDNDGFTDLYVSYWGSDVMYRNRGDGTFEDVTPPSIGSRWGTGCAFLDYDHDGRLDLVVANYVDFDLKNTPRPDGPKPCQWKNEKVMCGPQGLKPGLNRLWHNESVSGKIRFADVSKQAGIEKPGPHYGLSVTTLDYDRDGWPDIYVAVDSQASLVYHNKHDGTFEETALEAGIALSEDGREQAGMGTAVADYDGDGWPDLVKTNFIDDLPNLYRNNRDGSFSEATVKAGLGKYTQFLGWGAGFVDYDNDGWPDIFMVNGHVYPGVKTGEYRQRRILYRNGGAGNFSDVSPDAGAAVMQKTSARGLAVGDYDNDGRPDLLISNMNERLSLLHNTLAAGKSVTLKLVGHQTNRSAIGAVATLTVGKRTLSGEVRSGSTFMSQSDFRLQFGLGGADQAEAVRIQWPGGKIENIGALPAGQVVTIEEGRGVTAKAAYTK
ncbi:MAG: ASPIC/UnbV domain protein [Bryobacterales bacterium]|nr:ASPIC/UnbV domain protein [Bryobacterales bacterium]